MGEWISINTTLEPECIEELLNDEDCDIEINPYLFPLSSMTKEQQMDLTKFVANGIQGENILYDWYNKTISIIEGLFL